MEKKELKTSKEDTLILENKGMKFKDLLLELFVHTKGNFLKDIVMHSCHVINCPKDSEITKRLKYKGRWVDLFCGFFCEKDVVIEGNIFTADNKFPKKRKWN